ncbi:hypothetical protein L1987_50474 [Smallanthus sonchifolius]|uniref:Uncharacterized protein n=1 Tax=Smallanthus sonchifolius TaxID=185202 RepID=A0ACB9EMF2_9ASTR|nr:hypothetical protein L1987_50474 [Smallanthus sonchifolius]
MSRDYIKLMHQLSFDDSQDSSIKIKYDYLVYLFGFQPLVEGERDTFFNCKHTAFWLYHRHHSSDLLPTVSIAYRSAPMIFSLPMISIDLLSTTPHSSDLLPVSNHHHHCLETSKAGEQRRRMETEAREDVSGKKYKFGGGGGGIGASGEEDGEEKYLFVCATANCQHSNPQNRSTYIVSIKTLILSPRLFALDNMDEHILQNNFDIQLPSSIVQGNCNYVPYLAEKTFSQQHLVKPEDYDNYSLPQWIGYQHLAPNYVDYLLGNEISNLQGGVPYESTGIGCSFTKESFPSMDAYQAEPNPYAKLSGKQHDEAPVSNYKETQHKISYQKVPNEAVQHQSNMSASTSEIPTKSRKTYLRRKASESDRRRRIRIAAALDALDDLLPQSKEGNKTNVIDDCIDYIKYLQLQMRELSQNRLGGEPTSNYLMYLEGYGSYLVHENTASGPLQDMLGKLLDENPYEATKFLESRDLFMMPIAPN